MMGKRLGTLKITRESALKIFGGAAGIGAVAGLVIGHQWFYSIVGIVLFVIAAWVLIFTNWVPCGTVCSLSKGILDRRNFDNEASTHAWIGRFGQDFASYRIGLGDLPANACEGIGGLVLLVRNHAPASENIVDRSYNHDFAQLAQKKGVVSWGIIPGYDVIAIIGSETLGCAEVAARHCSIGTRDAVAMDLNTCSMMGSAKRFFIGPPPLHRQSMQIYGLCCK
jgi:hypothetical protein